MHCSRDENLGPQQLDCRHCRLEHARFSGHITGRDNTEFKEAPSHLIGLEAYSTDVALTTQKGRRKIELSL